MRAPRSHGSGRFLPTDLAACGAGVVFEDEVLIFHPETVSIGANVYVGHRAILKGYYKGRMVIGDGTWIGQGCFFHSAGSIEIGSNVGIGPFVKILTSVHRDDQLELPILHHPLEFRPVIVEEGADLGTGSILLPGVRVGRGAIVGAGAVVTRDVPELAVVAGSPARVLRQRSQAGGAP